MTARAAAPYFPYPHRTLDVIDKIEEHLRKQGCTREGVEYIIAMQGGYLPPVGRRSARGGKRSTPTS